MKFLSSSLRVKSSLAKLAFGIAFGFVASLPGHAAETASAQISSAAAGVGETEYTITLTDTGTTNLETFWYAWIPGQDYMPVSPTNITSPTGWTANITHAGATDGYAIQWLTSTTPLTPTSTFTFSYESTDTPAVTAGNSPLFPTTPIDTSFVYTGAPFSDPGVRFVVATAAVPEPSTWVLMFGGLGLIAFGVRRRRIHQ